MKRISWNFFFTIECLHKSGFCLQLNQLRLVKDIFCFNLVRNSFSFLSSSFSCHLSVSLSLSISHLNIMSLLLSYYLCLSVFPILTLSFSMLPPLSFSLPITQSLSQTLFIAYLSHFHSIFTWMLISLVEWRETRNILSMFPLSKSHSFLQRHVSVLLWRSVYFCDFQALQRIVGRELKMPRDVFSCFSLAMLSLNGLESSPS